VETRAEQTAECYTPEGGSRASWLAEWAGAVTPWDQTRKAEGVTAVSPPEESESQGTVDTLIRFRDVLSPALESELS
jgi:hypothetical protein